MGDANELALGSLGTKAMAITLRSGHDASVGKRLGRASLLCVLVVLTVVASGCGGSKNGEAVTIEAVTSATQRATSARFTASTKEGSDASMAYTGSADFAQHRFQVHGQGRVCFFLPKCLPVDLDGVFTSGRDYARGTPFLPKSWCEEPNDPGTSSDPRSIFGLDPTGALASLRPPESLQRIGTEDVRGVTTTHYRVVGGPPPSGDTPSPDEIWVDSKDQLRRITAHSDLGGGATFSNMAEFYDFGTNLTPISAPPTKTKCW